MGSGGHANSGPAPSSDAIRRERPGDQATWTTIPDKRDGPIPAWPLTESTKREDAMWERLWRTGQATQWETLRIHDEVALYVRTFCEAAELDAKVDARKLALTQMESLGLSSTGMARRRWRFASASDTKQQEAGPTDGRRRASPQDRFAKVIDLEGRRSA